MAGVCNNGGGQNNLTNPAPLDIGNASRGASSRGTVEFTGAMNNAMAGMNMGGMAMPGMNMGGMNNLTSSTPLDIGNASRGASTGATVGYNSGMGGMTMPGMTMNMGGMGGMSMPGMNMGGAPGSRNMLYPTAGMMPHADSIASALQGNPGGLTGIQLGMTPFTQQGNTLQSSIAAGANVTRLAAERAQKANPNASTEEKLRKTAEILTGFNNRNDPAVKAALEKDGVNVAALTNNDMLHTPTAVYGDLSNGGKLTANVHQMSTNTNRMLTVRGADGSLNVLTGTDQNNDQAHMNGVTGVFKVPAGMSDAQAKQFVKDSINVDKGANKYRLDPALENIARSMFA